MGSKVSNMGKIATAAFMAAFAGPYKAVINHEAAVQERLSTLEALGIKGDVLTHIVKQARESGQVIGTTTGVTTSAATLRILDDYINAARQTERAALTALLNRLTS